MPSPDGELELEDGTIFVISGGMIADIVMGEEVAPEGGEVMGNDKSAPMTAEAVKSIVETIIKETRFSYEENEAKFLAIEKENKELKEQVSKLDGLIKETFAVVEKIAEQPSVAIKEKNDGFMIQSLDEREAKIKEFRAKHLTK